MNNKYSIINTLSEEHFNQALALSKQMWWSKDRTREEFATMMKHCIPFVLVDNETKQLVGFARVLTDEVRYAYIYDVMVEKSMQHKGLGKQILNEIKSHQSLSQIKFFELTCSPDMTEYYAKLGFNADYKSVVPMRTER